MAFADVGSGGSGTIAGASSSTMSISLTSDVSLSASRFCLVGVQTDNRSTADGATNDHVSMSGGTGNWTKLGEYTNTVGGAAADGCCSSLWLFIPTGTNATATFTLTLSGTVVDGAAQIRRFTWDSTKGIRQTTEASIVGNGVDASNGFGSASYSSLSSLSRLYFRTLGKEANSTTAITPSTGFTAGSSVRSRNNAAAILSRSEYRINTSTGETSNPTLAVSGDTASVFAALEEYTLTTTHSTSGALTGGGATVTGSATNFTPHSTSGTLTGQGATVTGSAARTSPSVTHDTSGALTGQGSTVTGTAARTRQHATSGTLTGSGATVIGTSLRYRQFSSTGALQGQGATVTGSATRFRAFDATGALQGQGATVTGAAARAGGAVTHDASGALTGAGAIIAALAARTTAHLTGRSIGRGRTPWFEQEIVEAIDEVAEEVAAVVETIEVSPAFDVAELRDAAARIEQIRQAIADRRQAERKAKRDFEVGTLVARVNELQARVNEAAASYERHMQRLREEDEAWLMLI